jgi:tetratricopeptide (TPR) repeat protein
VAAQSSQPCVVKQYNQKEEKTPLPGVEVTVSNAGSTVSDNEGKLTLSFRTLKPGDKVNLISAKKTGYELFNSEAVEQWNISRDQTPFTLVLVNKEYFEQLKERLTQTSTYSYKRKFEQATKELEQQKKEGKLKEEEFNRKYDELETQYHNRLSNLDNYIDQFARIDLSKVSAEEQQILEMVDEGRIDEAVLAYEKLDISGKLRQARENKKALAEAKARIIEEEGNQDQAIEELKAKQEREIATLQIAGGKENYDKILRILKENALADITDVDAVLRYARFAEKEAEAKEAESFYLIGLNNCGEDTYMSATIQGSLGYLYLKRRVYNEANKYLLESYDNWKILYDSNPDAKYESQQAIILNQLGFLYQRVQGYDQAEKYGLMALDIANQLYNDNPLEYSELLAEINKTLGSIYTDNQDYEKAEKHLLTSLELYGVLFDNDPDVYRYPMAIAQRNMGLLYYSIHDYSKSEQYYIEALNNRIVLFEINPDAYRWDLGDIQDKLGCLYLDSGDYSKSEEFLLKALDNFMWLHKNKNTYNSPVSYRVELEEIQDKLSSLYRNMQDYDKSEKYRIEALNSASVIYPYDYRLRLAFYQNDLGVMFAEAKNYEKAEQYYLDALESWMWLYDNKNPDNDPLAYLVDRVNTLLNLGRCYFTTQEYDKSEKYFLESLECGKLLYNDNPEAYKDAFANNYNDIGYLYMVINDYVKAEKYIQMALDLLPDSPDILDSRGELFLMESKKEEALQMWNKIMELDPDFLEKYNGSTPFYEKLKEEGLIKE